MVSEVGKNLAKSAAFIASMIPKSNATAAVGAITRVGIRNNPQKKLSKMTTIAGG